MNCGDCQCECSFDKRRAARDALGHVQAMLVICVFLGYSCKKVAHFCGLILLSYQDISIFIGVWFASYSSVIIDHLADVFLNIIGTDEERRT